MLITSWNYTGNATVTVYHNEYNSTISGILYVEAGYEYVSNGITVVRQGSKDVLKPNFIKRPIPAGTVKPQPKGPSLRPFGG